MLWCLNRTEGYVCCQSEVRHPRAQENAVEGTVHSCAPTSTVFSVIDNNLHQTSCNPICRMHACPTSLALTISCESSVPLLERYATQSCRCRTDMELRLEKPMHGSCGCCARNC